MPWEESAPGTIVPPSAGTGTAGDICPSDWDEDFDRSQMSTQVLIGRQLPSNVPPLVYTLVDAGPPGDGELFVGPGPDYVLLVSKEQAVFPQHVSTFLRYVKAQDTIRITSGDSTGQTLGWRVTAAPIEHATYFEYPVFWTEGMTPFSPAPGVIFSMELRPEPPELWIDTMGKSLYGVENFNRTDLINSTTDIFETLADRILEVRGVNSVPRIEAVTIDARTGRGIFNMELMSTAAPEKPSRYRLRLAVDERPIFDRMMFVAAVRHFIARDEWTLRISLDVAEWAGQL